MGMQSERKEGLIVIIYDTTEGVDQFILKVELQLNKLGWETDHFLKHEPEAEMAGWIPIMQSIIGRSRFAIALRKNDKPVNEGLGIKEEIWLVENFKIPWVELHYTTFNNLSESAIWGICVNMIVGLEQMESNLKNNSYEPLQ
jgi:hypothetical protein